MSSKSYAEIEKDLPVIVKAELQKADDVYKETFAEEFGKKRRTLFHAYGFLLIFIAHRWYLGKPWMTVVQWITVFAGIGIIWWIVDLFLVPGMRRERNAEIAKSILAEQRILTGSGYSQSQQQQQPNIINVSNNK